MKIQRDPQGHAVPSSLKRATATQFETVVRIVVLVGLPVVVAGSASLATIPFISLLAVPLLLGSWVGCLWLALWNPGAKPSGLKRLGLTLLVGIGLLWLLRLCITVARLAGGLAGRYPSDSGADLLLWHFTAVVPVLMISWGQRLRGDLKPATSAYWFVYWLAYCPLSALAGVVTAHCGFPPGA